MQKNRIQINIVIIGMIALILALFIYFATMMYQSCSVRPGDFLVNEDVEIAPI